MDLFEQLRREHEFGIGTIAGAGAKFGVHRRVVRRTIASALPPPHHYTERRKPGSSANRLADKAGRYGRPTLSALCSQHRVPDGRRTSIFAEQPVETELSLVDPPQQLNAGNRDRRGPKPLEPEHRIDA
jgi:hypothetical protein